MIVIDLSFMIVIDCSIILFSVFIIPKYLNKRRKENSYEKKLGRTSEVSFEIYYLSDV